MDYKKTLLKRWVESEKQLSLQIEMEKITNELKKKITKKKKKLKVVKKVEEQSCSIEKVFCNRDIRNIIMKEKQKLLDAEWEDFKHIDWSKIMTITQFRDIITQFAIEFDYMKPNQYLTTKSNWESLGRFIGSMRNTGIDFWEYHIDCMDYYYEREAFQRKLNGEPLIDYEYRRQYPPLKTKTTYTEKMDNENIELCKRLRKKFSNAKKWSAELTRIGKELGYLEENRRWTKSNTIERCVERVIDFKKNNKVLTEYCKCIDFAMREWI